MGEISTREALIALSSLPKFNTSLARKMDECGVSPVDFFTLSRHELVSILSCDVRYIPDDYSREEILRKARRELPAYDNYKIKIHFIGQEEYPARLLESEDAPPIIFQLGEVNLDATMVVSVVGTRTPSPYGLELCKKLVEGLSSYFPDILIISGLAYGIDACAHQTALNMGTPTVAVVAHGLHKIYPASHRDLAARIIRSGGGIISRYPLGEEIYKQRFLERNHIVASIADATVVVESPMKGGAMSTATAAFNANREVFAFPGRVSDEKSSGCNLLIRKEKAHLITCAADLVELMGWRPQQGVSIPVERTLFPELEGDPKIIYEALRHENDPVHLDKVHQKTLLPVGRIMAALGELEYDGIIIRHPGNHYSIS